MLATAATPSQRVGSRPTIGEAVAISTSPPSRGSRGSGRRPVPRRASAPTMSAASRRGIGPTIPSTPSGRTGRVATSGTPSATSPRPSAPARAPSSAAPSPLAVGPAPSQAPAGPSRQASCRPTRRRPLARPRTTAPVSSRVRRSPPFWHVSSRARGTASTST